MPKLKSDFPVPISVRVSTELAERIREAADQEHRPVSEWVRLQLQRIFKQDRPSGQSA